jgi:flagellar biosynthesis protein FliR
MQISLLPIITGLLTIGVRLTGLMLFAPFFNSVTIPPRIKAVLVFALTLLLFPVAGKGIGVFSLSDWPLMILTEFVIGVGMGLATNLVFEAVQMAGSLLSLQMGYSLANIFDPQSQVESTVVPIFYQSIVMLLFLGMDVHLWLLRAVGNSFLYLPPGSTHLSSLFSMTVLTTGGELLSLGVQIAAPVLSATLVADIVLALLGKASPHMPVMVLGPAVKSMLGVAIFFATIKYWPDLFHKFFLESIAKGDRLLHLAH